MSEKYNNRGTKVDRSNTSRSIVNNLTNGRNKSCIEEQLNNSKLVLKEIDINSFMQGMYLEIKRLFGMYRRR